MPLLKLLVQRFPTESRDKLYAKVLCGEVSVSGAVERNPKAIVSEQAQIQFASLGYVGRGGYKLESVLPLLIAFDSFFDPRNKTVLDAGSSTGGFVDALLTFGARRVIAVDVGSNQLAYKLRVDPRVAVYEQTSIMDWQAADEADVPDFCTADLSFRSLAGAGSRLCQLAKSGKALVLIKPQFERAYSGLAKKAGFSGIVPEEEIPAILADLEARLRTEGIRLAWKMESGLRGGSGNREFFGLIERIEGWGGQEK